VKNINKHNKAKFNHQKAVSMVFVLIVFNLGAIPGASMVLNRSLFLDKVIILFDNDEALAETSSTIRNSNPSAKVVYYGSRNYFKIVKAKIVKNYILVAHGFENGVLINGKLVGWEEYAYITNRFHGELLYFVSCHSNKIRPYISEARIGIIIPGIIDARIAGLLTSAKIATFESNRGKSLNLIIQSIEVMHLIEEGRKELNPLLAIGNLKDGEIYLSLAELVIIILAIVAGEVAIASKGVQNGVRAVVHTRYWHFGHKFLEIVHAVLLGVSVGELVVRLFEWLFTVTSIINLILPYLTWIELISFGLGLVASIALVIASGSTSWWIRAAVYAVVLGIWGFWLGIDAYDSDSYWHRSSYHHSSSGGSGGGSGGGGGGGSGTVCFK
jgi:uncharacterized membrane protein YgcG